MEKRTLFPGVTAELSAIRDIPKPFGVNMAHIIGYVGPVTDIEIEKQFQKSFKGGNYKKGKNLVIFEVAKHFVLNFINFEITDNINQVALEAHTIILLTESIEYKSIDWNTIYSLMSEHLIFDTKFYLDSNKLINQGYKYITIGNGKF